MARSESFLEERREDLRSQMPPRINGIDYVEVHMAARQIDVHFVHPAPLLGAPGVPRPMAPIVADDISIVGGDRIRDVQITGLTHISPNVIQLDVAALGDFSIYTLVVDHPGMDYMLGRIDFGFRQSCHSDFDCDARDTAQTEAFLPANVQYLAKDYDSYRQMMLDRMAQLTPDWQDRKVPDLGVTLIEMMAHYADHLSYAQDAAGTEAYIGTARRRSSIRRHAQLLGYSAHDGLSAKAFVQVQVTGNPTFTRSDLTFLTPTGDTDEAVLDRSALRFDDLIQRGVRFFEPLDLRIPGDPSLGQDDWVDRPIVLQEAQNQMTLYDWSDARAVLPKGSTEAWIVAPDLPLSLGAGDFISLELLRDPVTQRAGDAQLAMRQIVSLIGPPETGEDHMVDGPPISLLKLRWHPDDALQFALPVGALQGSLPDDGPPFMAMAYGNLVLSDHGLRIDGAEFLGQPDPDDDPEEAVSISSLSDLDRPRPFRPVLKRRDISVSEILFHDPAVMSAKALLRPEAGDPVKAIRLSDGTSGADWVALNTLLLSRDDDRVFVPETESDGTTTLRFGGVDTGGAIPNSPLTAHYRLGIGRAGNIGAGAIRHIATSGVAGAISARNPLPGFGGRDRQSVEEIKLKSIASLDDNRRAVTRADYVRLAEEHPSVDRAHLRTISHGSWETYVIAVDPVGGILADVDFLNAIDAHLQPYRLMGQDLIVEAPRYAPLEIELRLCVCKDYSQTDVHRAVLSQLSSGRLPNGTLGFFHPDRLSFGEQIYLSRLIADVKSVAGVADVVVDVFRKWRSQDTLSLRNGILAVDAAEIPILKNNPNDPAGGILRIKRWETA